MGGSQKSKRVTWASDVNLCQVRLFLSEESPSQVGMGTQDHLQAKTLWSVSGAMESDDNLPPGFEAVQPENPWKVKLSQIPLAKWKFPHRFEINSDWRVVSGEESGESEVENQREMRVLEAIYPRSSAIPPNPSELVGVEESTNSDQFTPLVPITPIEDEDAGTDVPLVSMADNRNPMTPQLQHLSEGTLPSLASTASVGPNIVAVARAALNSVISKTDQGTLINDEMLIKLLSNPRMIEQLVATTCAAASSAQCVSSIMPGAPPTVGIQTAASSGGPCVHNMPSTNSQFGPNVSVSGGNRIDPLSAQITRSEPAAQTSNGPFVNFGGSIPNLQPDATTSPPPSMGASTTKDINYYKNLIQQHGGERRDAVLQYTHQSNQPPSQDSPHTMKPKKIMKPCFYFNTSRGCRNGANCAFQHDIPSQQPRVSNIPEVQTAKRVKMDREITGT